MGTDKMRKGIYRVFLIVLMLSLSLVGAKPVLAATKAVKLGKTISVAKKGAAYSSSDESVAYVSDQGLVTGKKIGKATVTVKKGKTTTKYTVNVKANGKKTKILVCTDEVQVQKSTVAYKPVYGEPGADGAPAPVVSYTFTASVKLKNTSSSAAKKVELTGKVGSQSVTFQFGKMKAGASKTVKVTGEAAKKDSELVLGSLSVYSGEMLSVHNIQKGTYSFQYGTPDKTKPVISGFIGADSYNKDANGKKIPYQIVYSDNKDYDFLKYVSATDDRDGKVELTADTSKVNFKKTGNYTVTYKARDAAGNVATAKATVGIRVANSLDKEADDVLKGIIKSSWSDTKKARAIYTYTRGHISYTGTSVKSDWEKAAKKGIVYGEGDCFTYYAVARALLTRAGIPNIEVNRVQGYGHHWWNMVYVQGGFYHFDTCPRTRGGKFCLVTDAQLKAYSRSYGNSHIWAYDKKPKSATKKLSSIF